MEIDCTDFVSQQDMFDFAHSEAEHGGAPGTAGRDTWNAALAAAEEYPYVTDDNRDTFEDWAADFGAWERDEIRGWTNTEATALLLQFIAGDAREYVADGFNPESQGGRFYCSTGREDAVFVIRDGDEYPNARFYFYMGN